MGTETPNHGPPLSGLTSRNPCDQGASRAGDRTRTGDPHLGNVVRLLSLAGRSRRFAGQNTCATTGLAHYCELLTLAHGRKMAGRSLLWRAPSFSVPFIRLDFQQNPNALCQLSAHLAQVRLSGFVLASLDRWRRATDYELAQQRPAWS
jgi:hypothetical protein